MRENNDILEEELSSILQTILNRAKVDDWGLYWETGDFIKKERITESIYSGNAGILIFLVEYYECYPSLELRLCIQKSYNWLLQYCRLNPTDNFAFYTGRIGTVYAIIKAKQILEEDYDDAIALLQNCDSFLNKTGLVCDFLNGVSGGILGLLQIHQIAKADLLLKYIEKYAEYLLTETRFGATGIYWDANKNMSKPLCGLSHGTCGIGFVLLEMGKYFEAPFLFKIAEEAFAYENNFFSEARNNWPDFRKQYIDEEGRLNFISRYKSGDAAFFSTPSYMSAWCHGAPGIGLTRLRAFDVLNKAEYLKDCANAIKNVDGSIAVGAFRSSTLCHGLLGNCYLFVSLYQKFNNPAHLAKYIEACITAIESKNGMYVSGYAETMVEDLSLFMGTSGIAYSLIQALHPEKELNILLPKLTGRYPWFSNVLTPDFFINRTRLRYFPLTCQLLDLTNNLNGTIAEIIAPENVIPEEMQKTEEVRDVYFLELQKADLERGEVNFAWEHIGSIVNGITWSEAVKGNSLTLLNLVLNPKALVSKVRIGDSSNYLILYPVDTDYAIAELSQFEFELFEKLKITSNLECIVREMPADLENQIYISVGNAYKMGILIPSTDER